MTNTEDTPEELKPCPFKLALKDKTFLYRCDPLTEAVGIWAIHHQKAILKALSLATEPRPTPHTNEQVQVQELIKQVIHMLSAQVSPQTMPEIEMLRQALTAPAVDVEALKYTIKKPDGFDLGDLDIDVKGYLHDMGFNNAVDYLASQGHIQPKAQGDEE